MQAISAEFIRENDSAVTRSNFGTSVIFMQRVDASVAASDYAPSTAMLKSLAKAVRVINNTQRPRWR
jgi:hypothetical protein